LTCKLAIKGHSHHVIDPTPSAFIKVQQGRTNTIAGLFPSVKSPLQKDPWKLRCIFGVFLQHVGCAAWILLDHVGPCWTHLP
jgi:hypothetical protein